MSDLLQIHIGDCLAVLKTLPDESVHLCVTSPPYLWQRKYGGGIREIGQERTPEDYAENLRAVFAEVRRVLRNDGIFWMVIGDTYASGKGGPTGKSGLQGSALELGRRCIGIELNPDYAAMAERRCRVTPGLPL